MIIAVRLVGLAVNALWAWRASLACRRSGRPGLRYAVIAFALFQVWTWFRIEPLTTDHFSATRSATEMATVLWTVGIAPGSLVIAALMGWRRRQAARLV